MGTDTWSDFCTESGTERLSDLLYNYFVHFKFEINGLTEDDVVDVVGGDIADFTQ